MPAVMCTLVLHNEDNILTLILPVNTPLRCPPLLTRSLLARCYFITPAPCCSTLCLPSAVCSRCSGLLVPPGALLYAADSTHPSARLL